MYFVRAVLRCATGDWQRYAGLTFQTVSGEGSGDKRSKRSLIE
jgi:hypothetical protein